MWMFHHIPDTGEIPVGKELWVLNSFLFIPDNIRTVPYSNTRQVMLHCNVCTINYNSEVYVYNAKLSKCMWEEGIHGTY